MKMSLRPKFNTPVWPKCRCWSEATHGCALSTLNSHRKSSEKCDMHCARVVKKRAIIPLAGGGGGIRVWSDKGGEIHPASLFLFSSAGANSVNSRPLTGVR